MVGFRHWMLSLQYIIEIYILILFTKYAIIIKIRKKINNVS
jgi:hypothetical protein